MPSRARDRGHGQVELAHHERHHRGDGQDRQAAPGCRSRRGMFSRFVEPAGGDGRRWPSSPRTGRAAPTSSATCAQGIRQDRRPRSPAGGLLLPGSASVPATGRRPLSMRYFQSSSAREAAGSGRADRALFHLAGDGELGDLLARQLGPRSGRRRGSARGRRGRTTSSRSELTTTAQPRAADRLLDVGVDVGPGADVDALRRLVDQQHGRLGADGRSDQYLLLVAAGQRVERRVGRRRPHPNSRMRSCPARRSARRSRYPRQYRPTSGDDAFIATDMPAKPMRRRSSGRNRTPRERAAGTWPGAELGSLDQHGAGPAGQRAIDAAQHRTAAGAGDADQPDDLALPHFQVDSAGRAGRPGRGPRGRPAPAPRRPNCPTRGPAGRR